MQRTTTTQSGVQHLKESTGVFGNALGVSGAYALRWHPGKALDPAAAVLADADNAQLLSAESSMDEAVSSEALKDESPQLALELHRLELKINVLLKITGELLAREHRLPQPRLARLSATGLDCVADESFKVGERGLLELFVNRSLPYALKLAAHVESEQIEKSQRMVRLTFVDLSEAVGDQLAKLIFRKHRRLVALAKHT